MYFYIIFRQIHLKFKCICLKNLVCHKLSTFDKPFFNLARNIKDHNNTHFFLSLNFEVSSLKSFFAHLHFLAVALAKVSPTGCQEGSQNGLRCARFSLQATVYLKLSQRQMSGWKEVKMDKRWKL